jgi:hypothetical protein
MKKREHNPVPGTPEWDRLRHAIGPPPALTWPTRRNLMRYSTHLYTLEHFGMPVPMYLRCLHCLHRAIAWLLHVTGRKTQQLPGRMPERTAPGIEAPNTREKRKPWYYGLSTLVARVIVLWHVNKTMSGAKAIHLAQFARVSYWTHVSPSGVRSTTRGGLVVVPGSELISQEDPA